MQNFKMTHFYTLIAFSALGVGFHILPHPAGFAITGGLSMLLAYYLPMRLKLIPLIVTVLVGQFVTPYLNGQPMISPLSVLILFAAHILAMVAIMFDKSRLSLMRYGRGALGQAVVFYVIANLVPMVSGFYSNTPSGWALCYIAGLPFLASHLIANLVYGGAGFLIIEKFFMPENAQENKQAHR